jgi:replicative DNA helicase
VHNPEGDEVLIPASRDTERTILGAIMLDNRAINEAAESMSPSDFFYEGHRRIFARMLELHEKGVAIDIITLSEALGKRREVEAVGGDRVHLLTDRRRPASAINRRLRQHRH